MSLVLPTTRSKAERVNPAILVIAGFYKSGKTTALSMLDGNLIADLEHGTAFLDAMKVDIASIVDYSELIKALRASGTKYPYITIDTGSKLEDIAAELAVINYKKSPIGKRFEGTAKELLQLPNGLGYSLMTNAYFDLIEWIKPFCETLILVCHIKNSSLLKDGEEIQMVDINLTGKLKTAIAASADAVGILFRRKNQSILSFKGGESFFAEARPEHLRGKEIVLLESDENNVLTANWDQIFIK